MTKKQQNGQKTEINKGEITEKDIPSGQEFYGNLPQEHVHFLGGMSSNRSYYPST